MLQGSSLPSDTNDTTAFTSNGLLDPGGFYANGGGGEGEDASPTPNPSRSDGLRSDDDGPSTFVSNGLLDGSAQIASTVNLQSLVQYPTTHSAFVYPGPTSSPLLAALGSNSWETLTDSTFAQTSGHAGLSIRATTSEGKPVFIRRKLKADRGQVIFSFSFSRTPVLI